MWRNFSVVLIASMLMVPTAKADWQREGFASAFGQKTSFTIYNRSGKNILLVDCEIGSGMKMAFLSPPDSTKDWLAIAEAGAFLLLWFDNEPPLELSADYLLTSKGVVVTAHESAGVADRLGRAFSRLAVAVKSGDHIWLETHFSYENTAQVIAPFLKDCASLSH